MRVRGPELYSFSRGSLAAPLSRVLWYFLEGYASLKVCIAFFPVCTVVYLAMAVGADGAHKARVIWSAICQSTNVVRLQIGGTCGCPEGRWAVATFAKTICARQHVLTNGVAA
jgi:hypothetical protein